MLKRRLAVALALCAISCSERDPGSSPTEAGPASADLVARIGDVETGIVHLVDHWREIESLRGDIVTLDPLHTIELDELPTSRHARGLSVYSLPWPVTPESLEVRHGEEVLERMESVVELDRSDQAYCHVPRLRSIRAFDVGHARWGRRKRGFPGKFPYQFLLRGEQDHLQLREELVAPSEMSLTLQGDASAAATVEIEMDGEVLGTFQPEGTRWERFTVPVSIPAGAHHFFVRARQEDPEQKPRSGHLVSLDRLEFRRLEGGDVLVAPSRLSTIAVRYLAKTPEPVEPLTAAERSFLATGGPITLVPEGRVQELFVDGQPVRERDGGRFLAGELQPGLHTWESDGEVRSLTVEQPLARLIPQALHLALRMRDAPHTDGLREGATAESRHLDWLLSRMEMSTDRRVGFWLPAPSELTIRTELVPGHTLRYAVGLPETPLTDDDLFRSVQSERSSELPPVDFVIEWRKDGGEGVELDASRGFREQTWEDREVRITPDLAGRGRLTFRTEAAGGERGVPAGFADPRLVPETRSKPPNLIVYLVDTLRADRMSCYGGPNPTTPFLDTLAEEGFLFESFTAVASWTRPSTATVLTGLYPRIHRVNSNHALPLSPLTLAEALSRAGYSTCAMAYNTQISARGMQFEQGFHRFLAFEAQVFVRGRATSELLNGHAREWLEDFGDEPFFLYLHSMDPHAPYEAPEGFDGPFGSDYDGRLKSVRLMPDKSLRPIQDELEQRDLDYILAQYDNEILYQDEQIRLLCNLLSERGLLDHTILVVLSDHGEEFLDHGNWAHARRMWAELLQVPLLIWVPPALTERLDVTPRRITPRVSHVDVTPSLLELLGVEDPYPRQGRSFVPLLRGESLEPAVIYSEEVTKGGDAEDLGALISGSYKLIWKREDFEGDPVFELYNIEDDPTEQRDLSGVEPHVLESLIELRASLQESMAGFHDELEAAGYPALGEGSPVRLTADFLRQLEELGYVDHDG